MADTEAGDCGTCGFCGYDNGYLGEQGDETTRYLHGAVGTGTPGDWKYQKYPNALEPDRSTVTWCENCVAHAPHYLDDSDTGSAPA
jgi:hypothetical protein